MTIDTGDFDAISERDLQELVAAQVPEGLRLEYKRQTYGNTDADKREFLKDLSAFANTQGGHLTLGIEEQEGVATAVVRLDIPDIDAELIRLEQIARGGLEPRISGLRIKAIPLSNGGHAILLRVPRSWNPPHRVTAQRSNRFYTRHSAGVHEPDIEELRTLFTQTTSALQRAKEFRSERLRLIRSGEEERALENGGRLVLHIVPVASFSGAIAVDVEEAHKRQGTFRPIGTMGMSPRFNYHGFINERGGRENFGYTQIFRNGALEATEAGLIRDHDQRRFVPGLSLERNFFEVFSQYILGLRDLGVPPPLILMLTLEGVRGVNYSLSQEPWDEYESVLPEDVLLLPECILEDFGTEVDHHRAIRPAFDALWNATGRARAGSFSREGLWTGQLRRG